MTTKIHAVVDQDGRPKRLKLTAGQAHDSKSAAELLDHVQKNEQVLADAAYDSDGLRENLSKRQIHATIKPKSNRKMPPVFSKYIYKKRNIVERFFNKLKHYRAIATRYEKHDENFLALIMLVSFRLFAKRL